MKKRLRNLSSYVGQDVILRINRKPIDNYLLDGFLVGMSENLLLLHIVNGDTLTLDGYTAVRLSDIKSFSIDENFAVRALRLLNRRPVIPVGMDLTDWPTFLPCIQQHYPLTMIQVEKKRPRCGYIGKVVRQTSQYVSLEKVNTKGEWHGTEKFAYKNITLVEFGDGYTTALATLVAHEAGSVSNPTK